MKRFQLISVLVLSFGGASCGGGTSEQTSKNPPPLASGSASTQQATKPPESDHSKELQKAAAEAFVVGYPALFIERQKRTMTSNVRLPLGSFAHASKLPRAEDADVFPSLDTLLSSAWLELHDGAWALKLPDMGDRWFAIEMFDAYGQPIGVVGKKTTGTKAQQIIISGPGFSGKIPPGATEIKSTTSTVWLLGRTRVNGDADLARVSALLKVWALSPLPPTTASKELPPSPSGRPQDLKFGGPELLDELGEVVKGDPPPADIKGAADLTKAGVGPGLTPGKTLPQEQLAIVAQGIKDGAEQVEQALEKLSTRKNGWDLDAMFGQRGAEPARQAAWVLRGLDWPVSTEGLVYIARVDDGDRVLSGAHEYALHFDKAKLPPAKSFWSVTMYSGRGGALVAGAKRNALSDTAVKKNGDGSVDITVSADAPAKNEPNWLPAPKGEAFMVVLRVYEPADGASSWEAPVLRRVK
jgi:hypothetical protein